MAETIKGTLVKVTFSNAKTGWTAARLKTAEMGQVTVVGTILNPREGDIVEMDGDWITHPVYGPQFQFTTYRPVLPTTEKGIETYLGSGLIKGIGPKLAKRIVRCFGEDTFEIIENEPDKLRLVDGIAEKRIGVIQEAVREQREVRSIMVFLQTCGISTSFATKIYRKYGQDSIRVIKENPYRLAKDIFGVGFLTADKVARELGYETDHPLRIEAGVLYVLAEQSNKGGHVYCPQKLLAAEASKILEVPAEMIETAIEELNAQGELVIEEEREGSPVYTKILHACERSIARRLTDLMITPSSAKIDIKNALGKAEGKMKVTLADGQRRAVERACGEKVMIITGGPGTGKTTIISVIGKICRDADLRVVMCAPTGRAAKRITEATGFPAQTIHRLLEFSYNAGGFQRNDEYPLDGDIFIVDESSMIDTMLMHHLLKAIPPTAALALVGDINQLPPVGPGNCLRDIIDSNAVPVEYLTEIFRQAGSSKIVVNAVKINAGEFPYLPEPQKDSDFWYIERERPEDIVEAIQRLMRETFRGVDAVQSCQVLSPMHKGPLGTDSLNNMLQDTLNPCDQKVTQGFREFRVNDKVMQIKNNYKKDVFNGDMGMVSRIDKVFREVIVNYDGRYVAYDYNELDELVLAYACTIHKSQGSEYPIVIIPMTAAFYVMLARNLFYTAVTRGKKLVVIVGTKKAIGISVRNDKVAKRYTRLSERLSGFNATPKAVAATH